MFTLAVSVPHMSTIWTPSGEQPVGREEPAAVEAEPRSREEVEAQLEALQEELARTPAIVVVVNHAMGLFELQEHPIVGKARLPRHPTRFGGTPAKLSGGSPALGQHTDEILREAGYDAATIAELRARKVVR